jgi:hypothetical protein
MPHQSATTVGTPLDRIVAAVRAWDAVPGVSGQSREARRRRRRNSRRALVDQAKSAVMLQYGVNSHVALGMLARWARGLDIPIERLARALVASAPRDEASP